MLLISVIDRETREEDVHVHETYYMFPCIQ